MHHSVVSRGIKLRLVLDAPYAFSLMPGASGAPEVEGEVNKIGDPASADSVAFSQPD